MLKPNQTHSCAAMLLLQDLGQWIHDGESRHLSQGETSQEAERNA